MIELDPLAGPDGGDDSRRLAKYWIEQIHVIKDSQEFRQWEKRGKAIEKRYRDERTRVDDDGHRRYASLWSNVEILKPALYARTPLPIVERRFKDKDPVGRGASQILERALRNEVEICGYHEAIAQAVSDYLLPGRGTVWVRYEPEIEESVSLPPETTKDMRDSQGELPDSGKAESTILPSGRERKRLKEEGEGSEEGTEEATEEKLRSTGDRVIRESTPVDFVPWSDFFTFPMRARVWREVTGVGKLVYMSRDELKRRFGNRIGKLVPLRRDERDRQTLNTAVVPGDQDKAQVYEIWSKSDETVYWVAEGFEYLLDRKDDPLELENFFPCPRPLFANSTNNTLIPVPDYIEYQDQALQIDELTQRIAMLTKGIKWAGVYNAAAKDVQRLFNEAVENELIPVDDWTAFAGEKGGVEGNISLLPIDKGIQILNELIQVKQQQIEEMDRLTGINDIMRGTSDARETLGGVRLKSNNTGTRLQHRQDDVARFARDTLCIMADIMCRHFSTKSLVEVSGAIYQSGLGPDDLEQIQIPTPQPGAQQGAPGLPQASQTPKPMGGAGGT